nr:hypothetical protein [Amycolatopsis suaedae]
MVFEGEDGFGEGGDAVGAAAGAGEDAPVFEDGEAMFDEGAFGCEGGVGGCVGGPEFSFVLMGASVVLVRGVHVGADAVVAGVGQQQDLCLVGEVGDVVVAGGGGVVDRAGQAVGDPQQVAVGVGQAL